ncbi:MAG TPA: hypothetical protein VFV87_21540, partial [Pirellulaceae bacterium]|nr:hypothetical protein [Pirellulaceae bacterium]
MAGPVKVKAEDLRKLSDEHLFAVVHVAKRVRLMGQRDLIPLAIAVALNQPEAAGSLFCATDKQIEQTLTSIRNQAVAKARAMQFSSSKPYDGGGPAGSRITRQR